ncbi:LAME_0F14334g1_1 [Lachancea meyersii CBS 8951]|uniref:non-specific serine/threonine protein kinase n=1 Tax=Lachancea meyersii CBS 8951 TaxID=1266667 RepID=A0A1G4JXU0_9SACH|nr:LAME_0F14334g1_1 [Lachancea meyersii CBS 8951]
MRQPIGSRLLICYLGILCFFMTEVRCGWPEWMQSNSAVAGRPKMLKVDTLHPEVYTAKPTVFRKTKTPKSYSLTPRATGLIYRSPKYNAENIQSSLSYLPSPGQIFDDDTPKTVISLTSNDRNPERFTLLDVIIATDLEGNIHALSRTTGEILWSVDHASAPLVSVSEPTDPKNETLIVEPYGDGNIYYYNVFQGLQKLPISIKHLVNLSPLDLKTKIVIDEDGTTVDDEKIYAGARQSTVYNINIKTGQILSAYGPGAENLANYNADFNCSGADFDKHNCDDIFVLGKTTYQLGIYNKNGLVYNVTYAAWQQNAADSHLASKYKQSFDGISIAPFDGNSLLAVDSELRYAKWISPHFQSTINSVFDVFVDSGTNERIILPHPLEYQSQEREENKVLIGLTSENSLFAMSDIHYPSLVDSSATSRGTELKKGNYCSIIGDDTTNEAILGVHKLQSLRFEQVVPDRSNSYQTSLPGSSRLLLDGPKRSSGENNAVALEEDSSKALDRYISDRELQVLRLEAQERIARELLSNHQKSYAFRFANFVYRIVEGGLMLVFSFFILGLLSKLKILAPIYSWVERSGLFTRGDIITGPIEIGNDPDSLPDSVGNKVTTKHVNIVEADDNTDQLQDDSSDRKKRKRGSRGGKKTRKESTPTLSERESGGQDVEAEDALQNLVVSKKVLGYGSAGTVVFQGTFQHRPVAIKRMLIDFYDVGTQEIKLLTESDHHPNVVRYYCSETSGRFLYIALELCTATLEDVVAGKASSSAVLEAQSSLDPINVLLQIAQGVAHLHSIKIVHRDLKPQNILVAPTRKYMQHLNHQLAPMRVLISDFGLCKRLGPDQSSFHTHQGNASGTSGWRAPELLEVDHERGEADGFRESDFIIDSSGCSTSDLMYQKRLTRAIDIFSMGCIFYYVLSKGGHPFGDRYTRDGSILKAQFSLEGIKKSLRDSYAVVEATDLLTQMLAHKPSKRPTADQIIKHPLFWTLPKKLEFLLKVSDRFEVERRVPPSELLLKLEAVSERVIPNRDWTVKFDAIFMENLGKYRKYSGERLMDLLRAFRNKYHHFMDLPPDLAEVMGPIPDGFYLFFARRFPRLLIEIYFVVRKHLKDDQILGSYL